MPCVCVCVHHSDTCLLLAAAADTTILNFTLTFPLMNTAYLPPYINVVATLKDTSIKDVTVGLCLGWFTVLMAR